MTKPKKPKITTATGEGSVSVWESLVYTDEVFRRFGRQYCQGMVEQGSFARSSILVGWLWVILVGAIAAWLAYRWILDAAAIYGDLLESAFDLSRNLLYKSLRLPLPKKPSEELAFGKALTNYLLRGFVEPEPTFEELEKK